MMRALNRLAPNLLALKCWLLSIRVLLLVGFCGLSPALWAADIAKGIGAYGVGQLQL